MLFFVKILSFSGERSLEEKFDQLSERMESLKENFADIRNEFLNNQSKMNSR